MTSFSSLLEVAELFNLAADNSIVDGLVKAETFWYLRNIFKKPAVQWRIKCLTFLLLLSFSSSILPLLRTLLLPWTEKSGKFSGFFIFTLIATLYFTAWELLRSTCLFQWTVSTWTWLEFPFFWLVESILPVWSECQMVIKTFPVSAVCGPVWSVMSANYEGGRHTQTCTTLT